MRPRLLRIGGAVRLAYPDRPENPAGVQFVTVGLGARDVADPAYVPGSGRLTPDGARCDVDYALGAYIAAFDGWEKQVFSLPALETASGRGLRDPCR